MQRICARSGFAYRHSNVATHEDTDTADEQRGSEGTPIFVPLPVSMHSPDLGLVLVQQEQEPQIDASEAQERCQLQGESSQEYLRKHISLLD
jgi:hypothetical protein